MKSVDIVCFGEILWDNLKSGKALGGAPLNVCYHLMKFNVNSKIITQLGSDKNGEAILEELKRLNIDQQFCSISSKPTSTVEVQLGEDNEVSYEIVENVAWDYIACTPTMRQLVAKSSALIFGSLVARNEVSRKTLFQLIEESPFRIFDVNLRFPFYSKELIFSLLKATNLLKLNEDELVIISEGLSGQKNNIEERIKSIQSSFPNIQEIILTRGSKGAIYFSHEHQIKIDALKVVVKDTVGSGDSFLACFVAHKLNGQSVEFSLKQASILSAYIASQEGACPTYSLNDLQTFAQSNKSLTIQSTSLN